MENTTIILAGAWAFAIATTLKQEVAGWFMLLSYTLAIMLSIALN